ncbi:hypothetical protein [Cupriavidus pauculus]|uniref:Uncharacterized protein n=1 Tax=Cupriavidus pauculus TaxID=82633 RepID=A0A2N5C9M5_9BURK|nr:hypothetical protein [Cupriavidus pauculus]PLP98884.1 hypothetical protein CYJ10_19035 [Cupriavidus pauculus]
MSKKEFHAFVCDSANGRVHSVSRNTVQARQLQAAMRQGSETARGMLLKMHANDEAATTNQLANAGNVSGLSASTAGVSATVEGTSPRQPGEGTEGDHDGKVQDGADMESLRNAIAVVEQILAAVKAVSAKRADRTDTTATGASTEDDQGWGGEGQTNAANATGESYEQTAPSLQNPNNAIAQRLDENTEQGMDAEEAAMNETATMLGAMGAQDAAFDARQQANRARVLNGLKSNAGADVARFRAKSGKVMDASIDAADAAMRAAGFDFGKPGHLTMIG